MVRESRAVATCSLELGSEVKLKLFGEVGLVLVCSI
jgi:hypothetical protein